MRCFYVSESCEVMHVVLHRDIKILHNCTCFSQGSGSALALGDIFSPGASRVLSRSSARR